MKFILLPFPLFSLSFESLTDATELKSSLHPNVKYHTTRAVDHATRGSDGPPRIHRCAQRSTKPRPSACPRTLQQRSGTAQQQQHIVSQRNVNQPMYQPTHFPKRQTYDSATTEPTRTAACLNRGQSSSPRTLGASTKTSHAQGPRTKQSYSDVVNESVSSGLVESIAPIPTHQINRSKTCQYCRRHCPNWIIETLENPAPKLRISPECHHPLPRQRK